MSVQLTGVQKAADPVVKVSGAMGAQPPAPIWAPLQ